MSIKGKMVRNWIASFLLSISLLNGGENPICAALAVQNNEAVIWKCLESVADVADCISICDLGSTDKTIEIVREFLQLTGLPGKIHLREANDFSHRSLIAAEAGKKTLLSYQFDPSKSYLLILDPDQIVAEKAFVSEPLVDGSYLILERFWTLGIHSYKPHLFRANLSLEMIYKMEMGREGRKWREFILDEQRPEIGDELDQEKERVKEAMERYKKETLLRRIEQTRKAFAMNPQNKEGLFLIANAHFALKEYEEALRYYGIGANDAGDKEAAWFAQYRRGECYEAMGDWAKALIHYLEAYQFDPARGEPLKRISSYYRLRGHSDIAYLFAKHGLSLSKTVEKTLFSDQPLFDYQFDEEISIAAYYTRFREEGYQASNALLLRKNVPFHIKEQGYKNLLFYIQNIKARFVPIEIPLPKVRPDGEERFSPMNPSIAKTENGYQVICRSVNYTQQGAKEFKTNDPHAIFRTKNFLLEYDRAFHLLSQKEIIENLDRPRWRDHIVQGLEDCRLFKWNGSSWFSCTTFDTNPTGAIQISLCKLEESLPTNEVRVEKLVPLLGPDAHRTEKNWLPFIYQNELRFIYSSDPFAIYKANPENGECDLIYDYTPEHDFSRFRGSAPPIEFDGGYLMMVHEVVILHDFSRCYIHRFVYLDRSFQVKKVSKPFTFKHLGVEYCLGMSIDHANRQLVAPIGIEDREAFFAFIDLEEVRNQLAPLPNIYPPF